MPIIRKSTMLAVLMVLFAISATTFAMPPIQSGSTIITPENAAQVVDLGRYGNGTLVDVVANPMNNTLAVATTYGVWLIDPDTDETLHFLSGHTDLVTAIGWSPDGKNIAVGSDDHIVRVYEVIRGEMVYELSGHDTPIFDLTFSPDSQILASSGRRDVRLWNMQTGEFLHVLKDHDGFQTNVVFSPDGQTIYGAVDSYQLASWDTETGTEVTTLQRFEGPIKFLRLSADSSILYIQTSTRSIISAIELETLETVWEFQLENDYGAITRMHLTHSGDELLIGTSEGFVGTISTTEGTITTEYDSFRTSIRGITLSNDHQTLFAGAFSEGMRSYNAETSEVIAEYPDYEYPRDYIPFSTQGATVVLQVDDHLVEHDVASGEIIRTLDHIEIPADGRGASLPGSERGLIITPAERDFNNHISNYAVIDLESGEMTSQFTPSGSHHADSASPNGQYFAVVLDTGDIEIWDVVNGHALPRLDVGDNASDDTTSIGETLWSLDSSQLLVVYNNEGTVRLWDVQSGAVVREYKELYDSANGFIWWSDGNLYSIQVDVTTLALQDVNTANTIVEFTIPEPIRNISFSPTFELAAVSTPHGSIYLVDTTTGETLNTLTGHVGRVFVFWSYDGALLHTSGRDGTHHLWGISE